MREREREKVVEKKRLCVINEVRIKLTPKLSHKIFRKNKK